MAVMMMNLLSQSLVTNPYIWVTPSVKTVNQTVTPTHQTSSQSNTFSALQQHNQVPCPPSVDSENEFSPSMSIYQLEHVGTTGVQDKVNETSVDIQTKKESLWQLAIQQQYIDSQKATLNAYVVSATGESTGNINDSLMSNIGLTDKYISLVGLELKLKYDDALQPSRPNKAAVPDDINLQTVPETISKLANQQVINHYNNTQQQRHSSLLHLSA